MLIKRVDEFAERYPEHAHLVPVRKSIYRLTELEGIQRSILVQQLEMGVADIGEIGAHLEKQAKRGADAAYETLGSGSSFNRHSKEIAEAVVGTAWSGKSFSETIWGNREKLAAYLSDDFAKLLARGASYEQVMKELGRRFLNVSRNDAYRLVYTEGTFVMNEASARVFQEQGRERYRLSCAGSDACRVCLDVQSRHSSDPAYFEERAAGVNFPPLHPWCRCSFTVVVERKRASTSADGTDNISGMLQNEPIVKMSKKPNGFSVSPVVNTKAYHDAFDDMPLPKSVSESVYTQAGRILNKTNGFDIEHMVAVNARSGALIVDTLNREAVKGETRFIPEEAAKARHALMG